MQMAAGYIHRASAIALLTATAIFFAFVVGQADPAAEPKSQYFPKLQPKYQTTQLVSSPQTAELERLRPLIAAPIPAIDPREHMDLSSLPPVCTSELPGMPDVRQVRYPLGEQLVRPSESSLQLQPPQAPVMNIAPPAQLGTLPPIADDVPYNPHAQASAMLARKKQEDDSSASDSAVDPHAEAFSQSCFPSATECKKCHEQIYDEWAMSSHANAAMSPMFHKFEQRLNELASGTVGHFCLRCHAPVAVTEGMPRDHSIFNAPRVYREGVTCVACHRVAEINGKTNGERRMEPGPLEAPVYGSGDGLGVATAIKYRNDFKVKTDPKDTSPGQLIHKRAIKFEQLSQSSFCMPCHQVAVQPGIKLEVVWEQYRASPACKKGVRCHDCHMGRVPGVDAGFSIGPAAIVNGKAIGPERKHSNHVFYGPGSSIAHPGLFPQDPKADRWSYQQWLTFDWRGPWGTKEFEERIERGEITPSFPPAWAEMDDRLDAREIIDLNRKRLAYKKELRHQVMENGSRVDGPFFVCDTQQGDGAFTSGRDLKLHYVVSNLNPGHHLPTASLGAQPQVWLNVALVGPDGARLWESGYLDSQGDLCDIHSTDALSGKVPFDKQLFNLQTKFLITNVKGTDRELPLPVNLDLDQLPFIRPAPQPVTVMNHPPFIRMEAHSIPPLGSKHANYKIPGSVLQEPGTYRLSVRMRHRAEPIYFMKFVNATPEMIRFMNENILDFHAYSATFEVR